MPRKLKNIFKNIIKGYLVSYHITKTGRKYGTLKGAGLGTLFGLGANGLTKKANLFIGAITGAVAGIFVKHYGDDEIFPYEVPTPKSYYKVLKIRRRSK